MFRSNFGSFVVSRNSLFHVMGSEDSWGDHAALDLADSDSDRSSMARYAAWMSQLHLSWNPIERRKMALPMWIPPVI